MSEGKLQLHYEQRSLLGRGGMGEVYLCHDRRIGREVAMKVIKAERGCSVELRTRFLRASAKRAYKASSSTRRSSPYMTSARNQMARSTSR